MAAREFFSAKQLRTKGLHKFLAVILVAPLFQIVQFAAPLQAHAVPAVSPAITIDPNASATPWTSVPGGASVGVANTSGAGTVSDPKALIFNGGNRLTFPSRDFGNQFTVTAWVKPNLTNDINTILSNAGANLATNGFKIEWNWWKTNSRAILIEAGNGATGSTLSTSGGQVTYGSWQQLSYVVDLAPAGGGAPQVQLYLNGSVQCTTGAVPLKVKTAGAWYIGAMTDPSYFMNASFGKLNIYNSALSQSDVQADYNGSKATYLASPPAPSSALVAPTAINPPVISGSGALGTSVSATQGTWGTGSSCTPVTYSYQWARGAVGSFTNISGATSSSYTVTQADAGQTLKVIVTANSPSGSTTSSNTIDIPSTAPSAPSGLTATPGKASATLNWTNTYTGTPAVSGYIVTAQTGGATCQTTNILATSCTISGLNNGTPYTFTVVAKNSSGNSVNSPSVSATPNAFTVTYDGNLYTGGAAPTDSTTYAPNSSVTVKTTCCWSLQRTNYTFAGWNTRSDGNGTNYFGAGAPTLTITANTILYAKWAPVTYTITYNGNSNSTGSVPTDATAYTTNASVTVKANSGTLARTNYNFVGWNSQADGKGTDYAASGSATLTISSNTTLYAKWAQYVLTYNSNLATGGLPPVAATTGGTISLGGAGTLTRTGYYFDGWASAAGTGGAGSGSSYTSTGSYTLTQTTTLYAKWSKWALAFSAGTASGVTGTPPAAQSGAGNVTLPTNFGSLARPNFYQAGWTTDINGGGTILTGSYPLSDGVTLYPRWAQYTLSYALGTATSGSVPGSTVGVGSKTIANNSGTLALSGFSFTGWNTLANGNGQFYAANSSINLNADITLYPYFSKFTITYSTGTATSGTAPSAQLGAGSVTLPSNTGSLAKPNYKWAGWTTNSDGTGTILTGSYSLTGNVTLYPRWAQYAISYDMTGSTSSGSAFTTLGFGNTTLATSAPGYSKDSATLGGWTTGPAGAGDFYNLGAVYPNLSGPITLYAKWLTLPGSAITVANTTLNLPLADANKNFIENNIVIRVNEAAGTHSTARFVVTVEGTNCSITGTALDIGATPTLALNNADTGFVLSAAGIANCSVTIRRPADADFGPSTSNTVVFQFYPINQITPLIVNTTINSVSVGTPIALGMQGANIGDGLGAVSYAAYGNNCFITISGSNYSLNATAPTQCRVIVTRAAWKQWAIATSQTVAAFSFTAVSQGTFTVPARSVDFGTTVYLYTTGGSGNGSVKYTTYETGCLISNVNELTSTQTGNCTVVAFKSASGSFLGQTSAPAIFTFTPINQSPIAITSSDAIENNPVLSPINLEISGGNGSGIVTYTAAPTPNCQIVRTGDFTATLTATSTGKCTVTAWKSASKRYNGILSSSVVYAFGIAAPNDLVIVSAGGITSSPQDVGFSLSTTGQVSPGGAITFARFNNSNCYFESPDTSTGTVILKSYAVGSCNVQATQAASAAHLASTSGLVTFTFTGGAQSALNLTFSAPDNTSTTTTATSTMKMVANGGSGTGTFAYTVQSLTGATCGTVTRLDPSANGNQSFATITSATPGVCSVTVVKSGDSRYRATVTTTNFTFTGGPQDRIYLTASSPTAPALSNVLVTLNGGSGTGAITFQVSVGCALKGQSSSPDNTINVTASAQSNCRVTATKAASGLFTSATTYGPDVVSVNFNGALQSTLVTTVDGLASGYTSPKSADSTYAISTTGGSGSGLVTFAVYGNGNCKLETSVPGTAYLSSSFQTATCSVVAKKAAEGVYGAVTATAVSLSFTAAGQDGLAITGDSSAAAVGDFINLTVTGGSGTGALKYSANNSSGGTCVITPGLDNTATVTSSTIGSCSVTVVKSGSGIYGTKVATSTSFAFGTNQYPVLTADPDTQTATAGVPYTLRLSEKEKPGSVTIYSGACSWSYNPATGVVTITAPFATTCEVVAVRAASGNYYSGTSNKVSVTFSAREQDPLIINASATAVSTFESIAVTVSRGSGLGNLNVVAYGSGCRFTSNSGGEAVITRDTSGTCTVQGSRASNGAYGFKLSSPVTLTWGQLAQTIPLVISNDPTYATVGGTITLTTVGGQGIGAVTFKVVGDYNPACVLVGNQLTKSAYGTCMIRATKAGDAVYGSQNSQNIVFTFYGSTPQNPLTIDVNSLTSSLSGTINLSTIGGSGNGLVTYVITGGTGTGTINGSILSASSAGTITVVATKQGDPQYASVLSPPITFTFTG